VTDLTAADRLRGRPGHPLAGVPFLSRFFRVSAPMSQRDPVCTICSEVVASGVPIVFDHGDTIHLKSHRPLAAAMLRAAAVGAGPLSPDQRSTADRAPAWTRPPSASRKRTFGFCGGIGADGGPHVRPGPDGPARSARALPSCPGAAGSNQDPGRCIVHGPQHSSRSE
jgi:hypothetical protein